MNYVFLKGLYDLFLLERIKIMITVRKLKLTIANENEEERKAYENVKEAYLQHCSTGINDYTNFKEEFVQRIFSERMD